MDWRDWLTIIGVTATVIGTASRLLFPGEAKTHAAVTGSGTANSGDVSAKSGGVAIGPGAQVSIGANSSPQQMESQRRRTLINEFLADYIRSHDGIPTTFEAQLTQAEPYINRRLDERGENWRLTAETRKQLGVPPSPK